MSTAGSSLSRSVRTPATRVTNRFGIRLLGDISLGKTLRNVNLLRLKLGGGLAADFLFFQIWDMVNCQAAFYSYIGGGIGVGYYWVSPTHQGPWNYFSTSQPIGVTQFDGFTRFTTAGTGRCTINYLHMAGLPRGVDNVYIQIDTGLTLGLGASTTEGIIKLLKGPLPFTGP
jgi:hypothetical protein